MGHGADQLILDLGYRNEKLNRRKAMRFPAGFYYYRTLTYLLPPCALRVTALFAWVILLH